MIIDINLDDYPKLKNNNNIHDTIKYLLLIGYNHVYTNEQNNIADNICNKINQDILTTNNKMNEIDESIKKLFGLNSSSNKKGEISENIIYELIQNKFKDYSYEKTRHIPHNADGKLNSISGLTSLVEIKNYNTNVNNDEVDKFKYDLAYNNISYGLFISIKTNIIGYKCFDYEMYEDNGKIFHIVYISKIYENESLLDCAIYLLEELYSFTLNQNIKSYKLDNIVESLNKLNNIIDRTKILNNKFIELENIIKNSFTDFYTDFRTYQIDLKEQINCILLNVKNNIDTVYINEKNNKDDLLLLYKDDKCFTLINRLFDNFNNFNIIIEDNNNWNLVKESKIIGRIKKLKDKITIDFSGSLKLIFTNKNIDNNIKLLNSYLELILAS